MFRGEELVKLKEKLHYIHKKDINLIVADFDDTIFERSGQFEKYPILLENRWNKWNEVIQNIIWIENFMKECFIGKPYPKTIPFQLRENHDVIITAWFTDIQKAKLKATWLDKFNNIIVFESKEKPLELIRYVIEKLQFIPIEITIYEDRPEIFIKDKKEIEDFLWTKLRIMLVKMSSNNEEPKITEIIS